MKIRQCVIITCTLCIYTSIHCFTQSCICWHLEQPSTHEYWYVSSDVADLLYYIYIWGCGSSPFVWRRWTSAVLLHPFLLHDHAWATKTHRIYAYYFSNIRRFWHLGALIRPEYGRVSWIVLLCMCCMYACSCHFFLFFFVFEMLEVLVRPV